MVHKNRKWSRKTGSEPHPITFPPGRTEYSKNLVGLGVGKDGQVELSPTQDTNPNPNPNLNLTPARIRTLNSNTLTPNPDPY